MQYPYVCPNEHPFDSSRVESYNEFKLYDNVIHISLREDKIARVDVDLWPYLSQYRWKLAPGFKDYAVSWVNNRLVYQHNLILPLPEGFTVDHEDGDGLNNVKSNLRPATNSQQGANTRLRVNNTSGFKGVKRHKNKWRVCIQADGKRVCYDGFRTPEEAAEIYDQLATEKFGEYAKTNKMLGLL